MHRAFCYKCKNISYFVRVLVKSICHKCEAEFEEELVECLDFTKKYRTQEGKDVVFHLQGLVHSNHAYVCGQVDGYYGGTYWDKDGYANGFRIEGYKMNLVEQI